MDSSILLDVVACPLATFHYIQYSNVQEEYAVWVLRYEILHKIWVESIGQNNEDDKTWTWSANPNCHL